ncbi:VOC family protein [Phenylobacterium sp.]|jgi:catechol 2,3-dioxygenase-like lactoylglutathione lyase family enzyme|uniref:VOC family protein n=1 Tax=Phenylobacterium sp. TaxID=1871053 RepID=UPI002F950614
MFDHLSVGVRDLAAGRRFYDAFFGPLGAGLLSEKPGELGYGRPEVGSAFFLYPVAEGPVAGQGAHIAFTANSRETVDAVYAQALARGATPLRAAGPHPDIAPDYYGAVLLDPDGNKLEVVHDTMH